MGPTTTSERQPKSKNKERRHAAYLKHKKTKESEKRDGRLRRKREEDKNPRLRVERRARNVPITLDKKRVWDSVDIDEGHGLGLSVDVGSSKRQKVDGMQLPGDDALTESNLEHAEVRGTQVKGATQASEDAISDSDENDKSDQRDEGHQGSEDEDDLASLMDGSSDQDDEESNVNAKAKDHDTTPPPRKPDRASSPAASATSTNISSMPDALVSKFPGLFNTRSDPPKILITTNINGTVHDEANILTKLFSNSQYIPRSRHRHNSHHYSIREIAKYASNRSYTALVVLNEDHKRLVGLTVVNLPDGPTFHFTITNWVEGRKLPGHGNPTDHHPELILNNFRTPLGLLTASLLRTLFPQQPEVQGRQVVTMHNQRDYIFVRRHRYVFRDRRETEKAVTDAEGKSVQGAEDIRAGLQELGPRFTLKLRRVDKGIQRASGQDWEWKSRMEKQRTKFQL